MRKKIELRKVIYNFGVAFLIVGVIDPLEGSVAILIGSLMIYIASIMLKDRDKKMFFVAMVLILIGVLSMFIMSSMGGFGKESKMSNWLLILIIPYPLGWLMEIVILIRRIFTTKKDHNSDKALDIV